METAALRLGGHATAVQAERQGVEVTRTRVPNFRLRWGEAAQHLAAHPRWAAQTMNESKVGAEVGAGKTVERGVGLQSRVM